ncbi:BTAD domain-containing putative transcriptional regulator [Micromonospora sp. NPDC049559]|uniref:AfsR/SARP family transcriptional regulator n=1 Tax=Micromonospora sp. NPDC049559 TaxID=3155923 RepID=UPI003442DA99
MAGEQLWFRLLGPLEVVRDTAMVPVGRGKLRVLLATLLLDANRVVPFDQIVERLWGEQPPPSARSTLHVYAMRLRRLLGQEPGDDGVLRTRPNGYAVEVDPERVDVFAFRDLLSRARQAGTDGDLAAESSLLTGALRLWRGPALTDVPSESLQLEWVARLSEERVRAAEHKVEVDLYLGRYGEVIGELSDLTREHPLRERLWLLFMLALARSDRQAEALAAYRRLWQRLRDDLGIEPGEPLQRLHQAILSGDQDLETIALPRELGLAPESVTVREQARVTPVQLPPDLRTFVGRVGPVRELVAQLTPDEGAHAIPLVIVTGPPGVGKTAVALHVAHRLKSVYPDGQLYVNLQGYSPDPPLAPAVVLARFLAVLGVPAAQIPTDEASQASLYRSLMADRRILVVLDNASDPGQVRPLLPGQPGSAVLVTSRDHLRGLVALDGGQQVMLTALDVPESRAVLGSVLGPARVAAEPDAVDAVARQCGQLPLALRIAAANLRANPHLSVAAYAEALQARGRLAQLRIQGDAQAAVRAAFDLSYLRLDPAAATLFRLLGTVPGADFGAPATAALSGCDPFEAEQLLDGLAAANLVFPTAAGRYQLHDLLREYAAARAGDDQSARAAAVRLFDFYLHTAYAATGLLYPDMARLEPPPPAAGITALPLHTEDAALTWLDTERPNLVAAVVRAGDYGLPRYTWLLADALRGYFWGAGHAVEGLAVCDAALAAARRAGDRRAEATVLDLTGLIHYTSSQYRKAESHHTRALDISRQIGDLDGQADSLHNLGRVCSQLGHTERIAGYHAQALEIAQQTGNLHAQALNINYLGVAQSAAGQPNAATDSHQQALELGRRIGNQSIVCRALNGLGLAAWARGELREAIDIYRDCRELTIRLGNRHGEASTLVCLAEARCDAGDYEQAAADARQAIAIGLETGERRHRVGGSELLATVRLRTGGRAGVIDDYRRALAEAREIDFGYGQISILVALAGAYREMGDPARATEHAERALDKIAATGNQILTARAHIELAHARLAGGQAELAIETLHHALELARNNGLRLAEARALHVYGRAQQTLHGAPAARPYWQSAEHIFTAVGAPEAHQVRALLDQ